MAIIAKNNYKKLECINLKNLKKHISMKKKLFIFLFFINVSFVFAQIGYKYDEQGMCVAHPQERFFEGVVQDVMDLGTGYFMKAQLKNAKNETFSIDIPANFTEKFEKGKTTKIFYYDTTQLWCVDIKLAKEKKKLTIPFYFKKYAKQSFAKKGKYISGIQGDLGKYITLMEQNQEISMFAPFDLDVDNQHKYSNQMIEIMCINEPRKTFLRIEK